MVDWIAVPQPSIWVHGGFGFMGALGSWGLLQLKVAMGAVEADLLLAFECCRSTFFF